MLGRSYRLGLVAALILIGGALGAPGSQAQDPEPCQVYHFGCSESQYDCCCGVRYWCVSTYYDCYALCGVTLTSTAPDERNASLASCAAPAGSADPAQGSWQSFLAADGDLPAPAATAE